MRAREPGERRAQEGEEVTPLGLSPDEPQRREERMAETRLPEAKAALEGEGDAERRKGRFERRTRVVERRNDDGDSGLLNAELITAIKAALQIPLMMPINNAMSTTRRE